MPVSQSWTGRCKAMATRARATAARQHLMPSSTWDKNVHKVKAGVQKLLALWPKETCSSAKACSMSSAVRTSAKGKPSAWRKGASTLSHGEAAAELVEKDMEAFLATQGKQRRGRPPSCYFRWGRPPDQVARSCWIKKKQLRLGQAAKITFGVSRRRYAHSPGAGPLGRSVA